MIPLGALTTKLPPKSVRRNAKVAAATDGVEAFARYPPKTSAWRRLWLTLLVHLDAFRLDPLRYVKAVMWRSFGLRLRARNQLAALTGRSPRAYALWIAAIEGPAQEQLLANGLAAKAGILPVICNHAGSPEIRATLRSLSSGSDQAVPLIVGGPETADIVHLTTFSELASRVAPDGTWLCLIEAGDLLAPAALQIYGMAAAQAADSWLIYSDDDLILSGKRQKPHFKSNWNAELFENHDFISGSSIIRATPEMLNKLPHGKGVEALIHEALRKNRPLHVPAVLHHRKKRPEVQVPAKPVSIAPRGMPPVAVIVPTRNRASLLRTCVEGVRQTGYSGIELIVVNNDSNEPNTLRYLEKLAGEGVKVLNVRGPFNFSALNNAAAASARSDLLCFLNNDVEIIDPDWLSLLIEHAVREDIGAVGARLLYPDGSVQHAGVVTGVGGGAAHAHRFIRSDEPGYFMRDRLPQRVSAVTAACLVVAKRKFLAVGGFDENDFPVAFNDVDLCLKLNARGWQSFYEPRAVLIHHESKSRGKDNAKENRARFSSELAALKRRWGTDRLRDPYHHPHLSPFCEQFQIAL